MPEKKIAVDEFVKNVRPDAKSTEPIVYLSGFVGESPVEGHIRVYADVALNQFVDIPKTAIAHSTPLTKEESSLGGSHLWVKQNEVASNPMPGSPFLHGDIYNQYRRDLYQPTAPAGAEMHYACGQNPVVVTQNYNPTQLPHDCGKTQGRFLCPLPPQPWEYNRIFYTTQVGLVTVYCRSAIDACGTTLPTDTTIYQRPVETTTIYQRPVETLAQGTYRAGAFNPYR